MYKCNWFLLQVIINIYKKLWNTWCSREWKNLVYSMLYGLWLSKVICVYEKLQMERLDIKLGGKHWNYLFCLPIEKFLSTHRKAELEICKILIDPKKMILVLALDVLCWGEFVQYTAELISVVDIIIHKLWNKNIFLGGILIIFTIDHAKILPFESRPFLASTHVIPCFRIVVLETFVRASGDENLQIYQAIYRYPYSKLLSKPELLSGFLTLVS